MPPRCFLGCPSDLAGHLHVFPNPDRFPDQFHKWVKIVGGQLNTPADYAFYRTKRLCDRHFTEKDRNRNNRLNALAVPSLFLSALQKPAETLATRTSRILSEIDMNIPLLQSTSLIGSLVDASPVADKPPQTSDAPRPLTGSRVLSEHNYFKTQHPKENNLETFAFSTKKLAKRKNYNEDRQIRNLKQQIHSLQKRCTTFKNRLANAMKMSSHSALQKVTRQMTLPAKLFTKMQFRQTSKKPSGRRFTLEEKILSLSFYKRSPKCYSLLKHCFTLPSPKLLKVYWLKTN